MGCDIHVHAERRIARAEERGGTTITGPDLATQHIPPKDLWVRIDDPIRECDWCDGTGKGSRWTDLPDRKLVRTDKPCQWCAGRGLKQEEWYEERNYEVFALLADVRNHMEQYVPLSPPRGLPPDVTWDVKQDAEEFGGDNHSKSWFTLAEIFAYDWAAHPRTQKFVAQMSELAEWAAAADAPSEDVRIVFWFDN